MVKYTEQEFIDAVRVCDSFAKLTKHLNLCANGKVYNILRNKIAQLNLSTAHFISHRNTQKCQRVSKICPVCNKTFVDILYQNPKKHKTVCSRSCSNTYFRSGTNHPNYKEPKDRLTRDVSYRKLCFKKYPKQCIVCGWDIWVEVHHLDENELNNIIENLVPLCPNHHRMIHIDTYKEQLRKQIKKILK